MIEQYSAFTVDDLLDLIGHCKTMAAFHSYLDESGVHGGSAWTVVAGAVGHRRSWKAVKKQWKCVLSDFKVSAFHATDLSNFQGQYVGWKEPKRKRFINCLLQILEKTEIYPVYSTVHNEEFLKARKTFPELKLTPYQFCCEQCITIIRALSESRIKKEMFPIAVTFEAGQRANSPYLRSFQPSSLGVPRQLDTGIERVSFVLKQNGSPLEVADMIAYEVWKELCRISSKSPRDRRYILKQLQAISSDWTGFVSDRQHILEIFTVMRGAPTETRRETES